MNLKIIMKQSIAQQTTLIISLLLLLCGCQPQSDSLSEPMTETNLKLWYQKPAVNWNHALPIGNGALGAMVFGQPELERLQLNEDTIWAGGPNNNISPTAGAAMAQVRALIAEGKYLEAQQLADQTFVSPNNGMPYQTLGNLFIEQKDHTQVENYSRELDIAEAIARVSYRHNGIDYQREYFASVPDNAIFIKYSASQKNSISIKISINSPHTNIITLEKNHIKFDGKSGDHEGQEGKILFTTMIEPEVIGGSLHAEEESLVIEKADAVIIRLTVATNFINYQNVSADAYARALNKLQGAKNTSYDNAKENHILAYQQLFNRVTLDLGETDSINKNTEQRIADFATSNDPHLAMLYFQYGRYLLISSSQPGSQPANLQGIWNEHVNPPWDSKYTVNINTEMNYWPAEITHLSELHQPLFEMLKDLSVTGQQSAREIYGAKGWMMHHNTDLWRITGQVDRPFYGQWQTASAWLTQHLWYHYLFTGNKDFLAEYYPVIRGAAEFFHDSLQTDAASNYLVVSPSNSPENNFIRDQSGTASITAGTTMDNQLVFDLFSLVINASAILDIDHEFALATEKLRQQLPPMQVGKFGQLQEWLKDWDDENDHHRHISHLYGLYPSNQISPYRTPELAQAAETSILHRGDKSTGWSMGWKINWWARLLNGDRAYKLLQEQIHLTEEVIAKTEQGGTYANMLDAHPPFQIDGNFGVTAGIAEMLVQSHDGVIQLLPALPSAWPKGSVKGLVTRGGFVIDMTWEEGEITSLSINSTLGGNARLRTNQPLRSTLQALTKAEGENQNPFFITPEIKPPLIKTTVVKKFLKPIFEYDLPTEANKSYQLLIHR